MHTRGTPQRSTPVTRAASSAEKRKRSSIGPLCQPDSEKKPRKQDRLKKRRVSFAPEHELTQIQTFSPGLASVDSNKHSKQSPTSILPPEEQLPLEPIDPNSHFALAPQPACPSPNSPTGQAAGYTCSMQTDMALDGNTMQTQMTGSTTWQLQHFKAQQQGFVALSTDVLAGLEGLAGGSPGLTAPAIGSLLAEEETGVQGNGTVLPTPAAAMDNQYHKWGFVPGADNTTDFNPEVLGQGILGDRTFRHVYGSGEDATIACPVSMACPPEQCAAGQNSTGAQTAPCMPSRTATQGLDKSTVTNVSRHAAQPVQAASEARQSDDVTLGHAADGHPEAKDRVTGAESFLPNVDPAENDMGIGMPSQLNAAGMPSQSQAAPLQAKSRDQHSDAKADEVDVLQGTHVVQDRTDVQNLSHAACSRPVADQVGQQDTPAEPNAKPADTQPEAAAGMQLSAVSPGSVAEDGPDAAAALHAVAQLSQQLTAVPGMDISPLPQPSPMIAVLPMTQANVQPAGLQATQIQDNTAAELQHNTSAAVGEESAGLRQNVTRPAAEQQRLEAGDVHPAKPMMGVTALQHAVPVYGGGDTTQGLLHDMDDLLSPMAPQVLRQPSECPAALTRGQAGQDVTMALLAETTSGPRADLPYASHAFGTLHPSNAPHQPVDTRQANTTLLHNPAITLGLGRTDSSNAETGMLLAGGGTTNLLAAGPLARPLQALTCRVHPPAVPSSPHALPYDLTMSSAAGQPFTAGRTGRPSMPGSIPEPAAAIPSSQNARLDDETLEDLQAPPELSPACQGAGGPAAVHAQGLHQRQAGPAAQCTGAAAVAAAPLSALKPPLPQHRTAVHAPMAASPTARMTAAPPPISATPLAGTPATGRLVGLTATHRTPLAVHVALGTPVPSVRHLPQQISFHEFLKTVDVQFLDHMRRGTSIGMADLASDPPPANLKEAYALLALTCPNIQMVESDMKTLQDEIKRRKIELAQAEAALTESNPPAFRLALTADPAELELLRSRIAVVKKMCRIQSQVIWKEWRSGTKEQLSRRLQANLNHLKADEQYHTSALTLLQRLATAVKEARQTVAASIVARKAAIKAALEAHNRQERLQREINERTAEASDRKRILEEEFERINGSKEHLRSRTAVADKLRAQLKALDLRGTAGNVKQYSEAKAEAVLKQMDELAITTATQGFQLHSCPHSDPTTSKMVLLFHNMFKLQLTAREDISGAKTLDGRLEMISGSANSLKPSLHRWGTVILSALAAAVAGPALPPSADAAACNHDAAAGSVTQRSGWHLRSTFHITGARIESLVPWLVQEHCITLLDLHRFLQELDKLLLQFSMLVDVSMKSGSLQLLFVNLRTQLRFTVDIPIGMHMLRAVQGNAMLSWPGSSKVTEEDLHEAVTGKDTTLMELVQRCNVLACAENHET